jgi:hypothetical protein
MYTAGGVKESAILYLAELLVKKDVNLMGDDRGSTLADARCCKKGGNVDEFVGNRTRSCTRKRPARPWRGSLAKTSIPCGMICLVSPSPKSIIFY